jgi:peptidoglycan lytic transglycosylase A
LETGGHPGRKLANLATEVCAGFLTGECALALGVVNRRIATIAAVAAAILTLCATGEATSRNKGEEAGWKARIFKSKAKSHTAYTPVDFAELPGWQQDDHLEAFRTFLKSCERIVATSRDWTNTEKGPPPPAALVAVCGEAARSARDIKTKAGARAFFERSFTPNAVAHKGRPGLLTGYYEPLLHGSRTPHGPYQTPIYKRPPDLVNVVPDTQHGSVRRGVLTYVRKTEKGTQPYFTRAQIDEGALKGKGLELLYLADSVDIFFLQIQGSGRIKLTDGTTVRVHYDGKNGHPYRSIGRYLTEKALLAADKVSMGALTAWLKADPERAKQVLWHNASYVFFRELKSSDDLGAPLGALKVPLTAGRSLALDPSYHALGMPIYVSAPTLKHLSSSAPFNRLMIGQDVGSAIRGPERGDIFVGSGDAAGKLASVTKHAGRFFVLMPKEAVAKTEVVPERAAAQPKTSQ